MSMRMRIQNTAQIAGLTFSESKNVDGDSGAGSEIALGAAKVGTLTTRTDNDTGTLTMAAGHGIATGNKVSIFWAGGQRHNVTVGTVATNSVPIDVGAGDNLPIATTAVTVQVEESIPFGIDVSGLQGISVQCAGKCVVQFLDSGGSIILALALAANELYAKWYGQWDFPPVFSADIATIKVAQGDSTAARTCKVATIVN